MGCQVFMPLEMPLRLTVHRRAKQGNTGEHGQSAKSGRARNKKTSMSMWEILLSVIIALEKHVQMRADSKQNDATCLTQEELPNVHFEILAPMLLLAYIQKLHPSQATCCMQKKVRDIHIYMPNKDTGGKKRRWRWLQGKAGLSQAMLVLSC